MEKYYTPKIEEFHVGFEYKSKPKRTEHCDYMDFVWKGQNSLQSEFDTSSLRVKYLDKQDIESLGFEELANNWFLIDAPGKLAYWTQVIIDFRWMEKEKPYKDISILGRKGKEDGILFRGNIKNKSELKKLLTQLNIK